MGHDTDELFCRIALEKGWLTPSQLDACREIHANATRGGFKVTLAKLFQDRALLTREQVTRVRREMRKLGVLPQIGGYEIISKIGEGGMGVVYKARQISLDRVVALKVLPPELTRDRRFVERFRREGRLAAKIPHPNAVQVYEIGERDGRYFMAMEFVDGSDVATTLLQGPLPESRALAVVLGVARALAVAHERGIVHRDIKPANIMVTSKGLAKLADLGIAKQTGGLGESLTKTGAALGTPQYMSPEQCRGEKSIDGRSDIYSLGATLFHMVCGRPPFDGETTLSVMRKQIEEPLPDPREANPRVSDGLASLIRRMMHKDVSRRYQNCGELIAAIETVRHGEIPSPVAPSPAPRPAPDPDAAETQRLAARLNLELSHGDNIDWDRVHRALTDLRDCRPDGRARAGVFQERLRREAERLVRSARDLMEDGARDPARLALKRALRAQPGMDAAMALLSEVDDERKKESRRRKRLNDLIALGVAAAAGLSVLLLVAINARAPESELDRIANEAPSLPRQPSGLRNVARGCIATTDFNPAGDLSAIVDGTVKRQWAVSGYTGRVTLRFDRAYTVKRIRLMGRNDGGVRGGDLFKDVTFVFSGGRRMDVTLPPDEGWLEYTVPGWVSEHLTIEIKSSWARYRPGFAEVEVYGEAKTE